MRHIPEAGAVCGNSARTDLRAGGRGLTSVPTATTKEIKEIKVPTPSSHRSAGIPNRCHRGAPNGIDWLYSVFGFEQGT